MTTPCLRNLRRCVTEFCRACTRRKIVAIKGASGSRPLIEKAGSKTKTGARLWIVGVDIAKGQIFARFPHASSARPPPVWYEQATSELAVIRYVRGPPVRSFVRVPGKRAEALDCIVYAVAALQLVNIVAEVLCADLSQAEAATLVKGHILTTTWMQRR